VDGGDPAGKLREETFMGRGSRSVVAGVALALVGAAPAQAQSEVVGNYPIKINSSGSGCIGRGFDLKEGTFEVTSASSSTISIVLNGQGAPVSFNYDRGDRSFTQSFQGARMTGRFTESGDRMNLAGQLVFARAFDCRASFEGSRAVAGGGGGVSNGLIAGFVGGVFVVITIGTLVQRRRRPRAAVAAMGAVGADRAGGFEDVLSYGEGAGSATPAASKAYEALVVSTTTQAAADEPLQEPEGEVADERPDEDDESRGRAGSVREPREGR